MGKKDLRIYAMLESLRTSPVLSIKELAERFDVSEMTIRRDLDYLKENRLLYEQNQTKNQNEEYIYFEEQIKYLDKKRRIAQFAAGLIEAEDILILDSGTTTGELSRCIPEEYPLTVLCYNFHILSQLYNQDNLTLIFAGGHYHKRDLMFESREGVELIKRTRASKMFVSAFGIHEKLGITCAYPYETATKRAAIDSALTKILVADSSKFGQVRPGYFAQLSEMDVIITDTELTNEWREQITSQGIVLHLV
ncbi:MAG: DeoR/GlpR family DNA-binding transcription regulator [Lachnospiraceae bacterium]